MGKKGLGSAIKSCFWIVAASAIFSFGFNWCYVPNQISLGGITGLEMCIRDSSLPSTSLISLSVDFSLPPRKRVQSQLPVMVLSLIHIFGVSSPVLPGVVPPLNLTAAYRSLWYARFGQGSSTDVYKRQIFHLCLLL